MVFSNSFRDSGKGDRRIVCFGVAVLGFNECGCEVVKWDFEVCGVVFLCRKDSGRYGVGVGK